VSNIYKYYIAYRLVVDKLELKEEIKKEYSPENLSFQKRAEPPSLSSLL
jgi:hypothetical protein